MRAVPFGIALKNDHPHGILVPVLLVSDAKLIANSLFEHCDGLFGAAMKANGDRRQRWCADRSSRLGAIGVVRKPWLSSVGYLLSRLERRNPRLDLRAHNVACS